MEKTLFLFNEVPERVFFFELEGDYTHLRDVYINSISKSEDLQDELDRIVYDANGVTKVAILAEPSRDWTHFVQCGFIL